MISTLLWLAIGLGILLVSGLWARLQRPLARMLGGMAPAHKITGGLIAMGIAGIPLLAGLLGLFGFGWLVLMPRFAMSGLYGSPALVIVFGLGYAVYRIGQAESQAPDDRHQPVVEAGLAAPDVTANAMERFNAGMQMALGIMIALTTGTCTMMMVAYGVDQSPGFALAMLAIGAPLPGAGLWLLVHGNRRLRASSPPPRPVEAPPGRPLSDGASAKDSRRFALGVVLAVFGSGMVLLALMDLVWRSYEQSLNTVSIGLVLGAAALGAGVWLLRGAGDGAKSGGGDAAAREDRPSEAVRGEAVGLPADAPSGRPELVRQSRTSAAMTAAMCLFVAAAAGLFSLLNGAFLLSALIGGHAGLRTVLINLGITVFGLVAAHLCWLGFRRGLAQMRRDG